MIPRLAHFVFGLDEQTEPFHFVQYLSVASTARVLRPDRILFHHHHLPWGPWWERTRSLVTLVPATPVPEVLTADYSEQMVPEAYRYAHHADFVRLDALIEYGGIYVDIDTVFVRDIPPELFDAPFVIGREPPLADPRTGRVRPSLCNALLLAEPGAPFAREWRARMAAALDGTWSNHSGFLPHELSLEMPAEVRVEPVERFFPFDADITGLRRLLLERCDLPPTTVSVHLAAHLWWQRARRDHSWAHQGWCTPAVLRWAPTTFAGLARPYLSGPPEELPPAGRASPAGAKPTWVYLSVDQDGGYGIAADRARSALEDAGVDLRWLPMVPGGHGYYEPVPFAGLAPATSPALPPPVLPAPAGAGPAPPPASAGGPGGITAGAVGEAGVVVAHLVPEYYPGVRGWYPDAFLVGHTAWETDRLPDHWDGLITAVDLVVVPSAFSAEPFLASPAGVPVAVVPHVAPPPRPARFTAWSAIPAETFVFYTIGEWNDRKAVDKVIEAYLRAFTAEDPVLLVVKTSFADRRWSGAVGPGVAGQGTTTRAVAALLAGRRNNPSLTLVTRDLTDDDIASLHRRGDCYVSLSRGEAWGIGAFDAAACGNPVVMTGYGGQTEYLRDSPYLVAYDLVAPQVPTAGPYGPAQRWAEPDVDHAATLLRSVWRDAAGARSFSAGLAEEIHRLYSPEVVAARFLEVVADAVSATPAASAPRRRSDPAPPATASPDSCRG